MTPGEAGGAACEVLVVDDDRDTRDVVTALLELSGYRARPVSSGREALETMAAMPEPPRLVLLDLVMPGMGGFDVVREMRTRPRLDAVCVVVLTGLAELPHRDLPGLALQGVMRKPPRVDELLGIVKRFVG